jgi:hypothetical protein
LLGFGTACAAGGQEVPGKKKGPARGDERGPKAGSPKRATHGEAAREEEGRNLDFSRLAAHAPVNNRELGTPAMRPARVTIQRCRWVAPPDDGAGATNI